MDDLGNRAEDASIAASAGAQQLPVKLEGRSREVEHELNRTVQVTNIISRLKIRIKVNKIFFLSRFKYETFWILFISR